jgi:hypothetical protein
VSTDFEAWVIYAESPGSAPRSTDDAFFPWGWGEVIAVLPPTADSAERQAALAAVVQTAHFASGDRSDIVQFADRNSYLGRQIADEYFDAFHPYLAVSKARNLRYEDAQAGQVRGRLTFDRVGGEG